MLPSGLSLAEAEKLSKQQQTTQTANKSQLQEGQMFLYDIGEGGKRLYQYQNEQLVGLSFDFPTDWQGRTIGQWQNITTDQALSSLKIDQSKIIDLTKQENYLWRDVIQGIPQVDLTNFEQFKSRLIGNTPTGGTLQSLPDVVSPSQSVLGAAATGQAIAPEGTIQGIQSIVPNFIAANANLQAQGIYGAVRVAGSPNVFTVGPGGTWETEESFAKKFGTSDQGNIVTEISKDQAIQLGIKEQSISAAPETNPNLVISGETIGQQEDLIDLSDIGAGTGATQTNPDIVFGSVTATQKSLEDYIKLITETTATPAGDTLDDLMKKFETSLGESEGRGAYQQAQEEAQGVAQKKAALTAINNQIITKQAEVNALDASYQQANQAVEGKPITLQSIQGQQAQNYKMYLAQRNSLIAEAGLLEAKALGAQNELTLAQDAANRATDLKYADIETRLNNQLQLINIAKDRATKEENTRLQALELYLTDQKEAVADRKQLERDIANVMIQVASTGQASNDVLNRITKATSYQQAIAIASPYLKAEVSTTIIEQDGRQVLINSKTGDVIRDLGAVSVEGWSEPYTLAGDLVQKNLKTGQIRTVVNVSGGGDDIDTGVPSDNEIRDYILKNKRNNPNMVWYDLWGALADDMTARGLNPSNYDKQFWELLHPEGEAGYQQYVKGQEGKDEIDTLIETYLKKSD